MIGRSSFTRISFLLVLFIFPQLVQAQNDPSLEAAFVFGSRNLTCEVANEPGTNYTMVHHINNQPATIAYDAGRGWGYEVIDPGNAGRAGFAQFGPFDESANNRNVFTDPGCQTEIYDSFIGAKGFTTPCNEFIVDPPDPEVPCSEVIDPEGIVFRVDVPNGFYQFVAVAGSSDNAHVSRILVEDGGEGAPVGIGPNHAVLFSNFNQAHHERGQLARTGFGCFLPPNGIDVQFIDHDDDGLLSEDGPISPVLEVTEGYIRVHQLQGNAATGLVRGADANGGNMILLELWRVDSDFVPSGGAFVDVTRTISPIEHGPGDEITVTLNATGVTVPTTLTEGLPAGFSVVDNGGGTVEGSNLTFSLDDDGEVTYTIRAPEDTCLATTIVGTGEPEGGCSATYTGDTGMVCAGALSTQGGVQDFLIIGPIDLGFEVGAACDDNGLLGSTDYLTDGEFGESNLVVEEGDFVEPDHGGAAGGLGVKPAGNPDRNAGGILEVYRLKADQSGYINYELPENVGPTDQYLIYAITYLNNRSDACRDVILEVGSDDAVKVIVNGVVAHVNSVCRGVGPYGNGDRVPVTLVPGLNDIKVATIENGGGSGVRVVVRDTDDLPITDGSIITDLIPPDEVPGLDIDVARSIDPETHAPGQLIEINLEVTGDPAGAVITETFPEGFAVNDDGGGTVDGNTIAFSPAAAGTITYVIQAPDDRCDCSNTFGGSIVAAEGCKAVSGANTIICALEGGDCPNEPGDEDAELIAAFTFGPRLLLCPSNNDDSITYTNLIQAGPDTVIYNPDLGYGYEVILPGDASRGGYGQFGAFDDSPNNRGAFPDDGLCNDAIYGQFIGAKNFAIPVCNSLLFDPPDPDAPCSDAIAPDGIIFRVDLEPGLYKFVAAVGDAENPHSHRILAEDGGVGGPADITDAHVVLVDNFDQAQQGTGTLDANRPGEGVFARVGFDGRYPPEGDGNAPDPVFVNMDEEGKATSSCPNSPTLEVTEDYLRIHQLQGNSNPGCGWPAGGNAGTSGDPNGGDLVVLEIWRISDEVDPGPEFKRGDTDGNGALEITDPINNLAFQFLGTFTPPCMDAADFDDNGKVEITDPIANLSHQFLGTAPPAPPGKEVCGPDPSDDADGVDLGCEVEPAC